MPEYAAYPQMGAGPLQAYVPGAERALPQSQAPVGAPGNPAIIIDEEGPGDVNISIVNQVRDMDRALNQGIRGLGEERVAPKSRDTREALFGRSTNGGTANLEGMRAKAAKGRADALTAARNRLPMVLEEDEGERVRAAVESYDPEAIMRAELDEDEDFYEGADAVHTTEEAEAALNQALVLDDAERVEVDKFNHPLSDAWVKDLPSVDDEVVPGKACVLDCQERTRIKELECDEVRRRVLSKLEDLGCPSLAIPVVKKSPCS